MDGLETESIIHYRKLLRDERKLLDIEEIVDNLNSKKD